MSQSEDQPSANTRGRSRPMTLVGEKQMPELPLNPPSLQHLITSSQTAKTETALPPDIQQEFIARSAWKQGVLGSLNVISVILAVRLTLLLSVGGAIYLTYLALQGPDLYRLATLGIYAGVVIPSMVWLASRR